MKGKKIIFLIIPIIIGIGLGVGGTWAAQKFIFKNTTAAVTKAPKKDGPLVPVVVDFPLILKGGGFLSISLTVEGVDAKAETTLTEKVPFMKDKMITVLSDKTMQDVETPEAIEKIRSELLTQLNTVAEDKIQSILFEKFVYQEQ